MYSDFFSPARDADGSWLDNGRGTDVSTCEYQIYYAEYGYYCRQAQASQDHFSPAYVLDGSWVNDFPATNLESYMDEIWELL